MIKPDIEVFIAISACWMLINMLIEQSSMWPYRSPDIFRTYREWQAVRRERFKFICWLVITFFLHHHGYLV